MSDYANLDGEPAPIKAATDAMDDLSASPTRRKVGKALDKAETLAAKKLGAAEAHRLREQADVAIDRGETLYGQGRAFLDDQLAVAPYRTVAAAALAGLFAGALLAPRKKKIIRVKEGRGGRLRA